MTLQKHVSMLMFWGVAWYDQSLLFPFCLCAEKTFFFFILRETWDKEENTASLKHSVKNVGWQKNNDLGLLLHCLSERDELDSRVKPRMKL